MTHRPLTTLLTPAGRGAVATIVYEGSAGRIDNARLFRAANGTPLDQQPINQILFGHWGSEPGEEVVLCRTSETLLEIHCHGGHAASDAILLDLSRLGCEHFRAWDYLERTQGTFERQAAEALAHAPTPRTAAIIAHQTFGPLRMALARLAHADTLPEERRDLIDGLLQWSNFATHLIEPWRVVIFGRPNVGKSSLMNALAGFERAIVLDSPGTTRDLVTAELALDGWPIRLTDTAGIRTDADELETLGINRAKTDLARADLRLFVLDRASVPTPEELAMIDESPTAIIVANKSDLENVWGDALPPAVHISARTGDGLAMLIKKIVSQLVPTIPSAETAIPVSAEQVKTLQSTRATLH